MEIDILPKNVLSEIFHNLDFKQIIICSQVCKKWNNSSKSGNIWKKKLLEIFSTLNTEHPQNDFYEDFKFMYQNGWENPVSRRLKIINFFTLQHDTESYSNCTHVSVRRKMGYTKKYNEGLHYFETYIEKFSGNIPFIFIGVCLEHVNVENALSTLNPKSIDPDYCWIYNSDVALVYTSEQISRDRCDF
eukprot:TRINITY_DN5126_c0_g1_i1.p1 TRINITY_DN5126_c0_g1~~TRINITY_DN5126_c0_g1_i1.p1  ORF type:complete len:189 (+),score=33.10 TRINITY_DN5126_c0_g1_i1:368-934(+)